ncbi:MAG: GyrI-like domain-containing protein [Bacteroidota bacterium]
MRFLKWLLYIILALAALILIIPLFLPSEMSIGTTVEVKATQAQVFHVAATYTDRGSWDPWMEMDSTATLETLPQKEYVGSSYTWKGETIGNGKMQVDSVDWAKHIWASIWFGPDPRPSQVEWILEPAGDGTLIHWNFHTKMGYPVGRIMMLLMKKPLQGNFDKGMQNFKAYIEANLPQLSSLSPIEEKVLNPMSAMVVAGEGTMEEMGPAMGTYFAQLSGAIQNQGLQVSGAPFCQYLEYDPVTGITKYLVGMPVAKAGKNEGAVMAKTYPEMKVLQAVHTGPYEELYLSYDDFNSYFQSNGITPKGQAFEFYLNDPMVVKFPTGLETLIAFPY